jgi:hypothetical protein
MGFVAAASSNREKALFGESELDEGGAGDGDWFWVRVGDMIQALSSMNWYSITRCGRGTKSGHVTTCNRVVSRGPKQVSLILDSGCITWSGNSRRFGDMALDIDRFSSKEEVDVVLERDKPEIERVAKWRAGGKGCYLAFQPKLDAY